MEQQHVQPQYNFRCSFRKAPSFRSNYVATELLRWDSPCSVRSGFKPDYEARAFNPCTRLLGIYNPAIPNQKMWRGDVPLGAQYNVWC